MRIRITVTACLLLAAIQVAAQKKELSQARTYLKSGKDFDKAEKLMTNLLKDSANRGNLRIYRTWFEAVKAQYNAANETLYLNQKYDTAAFFNLTRHLFDVGLLTDSVDALPDKKGRVRPSLRKDNAELLSQLRPNLYFGGTYFIRKNDFMTAFDCFDHYIDAARKPLLAAYPAQERDTLTPQAAYWATYCGFKLNDTDKTLRYARLALQDHDKMAFTLQYLCEAHLAQKNDSAYISTLCQGFDMFPQSTYFFPRLVDHYKRAGDFSRMISLADKGLAVDKDNTLFLLAKSIALLNLERYQECVSVSRRMITLNDTLPEPYFNIATSYLNQALAVEQENEPRKNFQRLRELYTQAKPYMEDYRRLAPDSMSLWAPGLYRIYLNLNMGRQFDEIDKLMRKQ